MSECSDGLASANLPLTNAAFRDACSECELATDDEYSFPATLGHALDAVEHGTPLTQLQIRAFVHAANMTYALFADVNL